MIKLFADSTLVTQFLDMSVWLLQDVTVELTLQGDGSGAQERRERGVLFINI